MAIDTQIVNIVILNCGYTSTIIEKARGQYHDIFAALLQAAVDRLSTQDGRPKVRLQMKGWDVVSQKYPTTLDSVDAIIVTGSPNGAYQDLDWINTLNQYISRMCIQLNLSIDEF